jgi:hypothetical protein
MVREGGHKVADPKARLNAYAAPRAVNLEDAGHVLQRDTPALTPRSVAVVIAACGRAGGVKPNGRLGRLADDLCDVRRLRGSIDARWALVWLSQRWRSQGVVRDIEVQAHALTVWWVV